MDAPAVDWDALREAARGPPKKKPTPPPPPPPGGGGAGRRRGREGGAAGLVDDGRVVSGCNVENAAYGVGLCAECGMVSALHASGGGRLVAVVCVGPEGDAVMPCGRCRQLLWENGGPAMLLETARGAKPMTEVLPLAFGVEQLTAATDRPP